MSVISGEPQPENYYQTDTTKRNLPKGLLLQGGGVVIDAREAVADPSGHTADAFAGNMYYGQPARVPGAQLMTDLHPEELSPTSSYDELFANEMYRGQPARVPGLPRR